jgi:hypothetical protein
MTGASSKVVGEVVVRWPLVEVMSGEKKKTVTVRVGAQVGVRSEAAL